MHNTSHHTTALLLIAHGSRRQEANDDLLLLAEMIRKKHLFAVVEVSYLEVVEPTIPQGATKCVQQKVNEVLMFPYFLSAGDHVTKDLEQYRRQFSEQYPSMQFRLCPPLGLHPLMLDIVMSRIAEEIDLCQ